jgi:hypothetical protein
LTVTNNGDRAAHASSAADDSPSYPVSPARPAGGLFLHRWRALIITDFCAAIAFAFDKDMDYEIKVSIREVNPVTLQRWTRLKSL